MNLQGSVRWVIQILLTLSLATACGLKSEFEDGQVASSKAVGDTSNAPEPSSSDSSAPADSVNVQEPASNASQQPHFDAVASEDASLRPEASQPVVVGGAYISCVLASKKNELACVVKDSKGEPQSYTQEQQMQWVFVPISVNPVEIPISPIVKETPSTGTIFFLPVYQESGEIRFKGEADALSFDIAPLYRSDAELVRYATAVKSLPNNNLKLDFSVAGSGIYGDGNMGTEGDSCLGAKPSGASSKSFRITGSVTGGTVETSAYLGKICGLQHSGAYVTFSGKAPFKPLKIFLLPETQSLLLFEGIPLPPGDYQVELHNEVKAMADGSLDDFSLGFLQIDPANPNNANFGFKGIENF